MGVAGNSLGFVHGLVGAIQKFIQSDRAVRVKPCHTNAERKRVTWVARTF